MIPVRAIAAATLFATAASAQIAGAANVDISVNPLLGADAPAERGWQPFGVRLRGLGHDDTAAQLAQREHVGAPEHRGR